MSDSVGSKVREWYGYLNDPVHNAEHAYNVMRNGAIIFNSIAHITDVFPDWFHHALVLACLYHDVRDHKHQMLGTKMVSQQELDIHLYDEMVKHTNSFDDANIAVTCIQEAINRSSWSKRKETANYINSGHVKPDVVVMIKILQDADWIEALGEDGITRAVEWRRLTIPDMSEEDIKKGVIEHAHEKLLRIPEELNYEWSKKIAADRLIPIKKYIDV